MHKTGHLCQSIARLILSLSFSCKISLSPAHKRSFIFALHFNFLFHDTMPIHINRSGFICLSSAAAVLQSLFFYIVLRLLGSALPVWHFVGSCQMHLRNVFVGRSLYVCVCVFIGVVRHSLAASSAPNIAILNLCYQKIEFRIH